LARGADDGVRQGFARFLVSRSGAQDRLPRRDGGCEVAAPEECERQAAGDPRPLVWGEVRLGEDFPVERHGPGGLSRKGKLVGVFPQHLAPPGRILGDGPLEHGRGLAICAAGGRSTGETHRRIDERLPRLRVRGGGFDDTPPRFRGFLEGAAPKERKGQPALGAGAIRLRGVLILQPLPVERHRFAGSPRKGQLVGVFEEPLAPALRCTRSPGRTAGPPQGGSGRRRRSVPHPRSAPAPAHRRARGKSDRYEKRRSEPAGDGRTVQKHSP
jgi:hypothetical protein